MICQAANPLLTLADPARSLAALRALELLVVMDYYLTPTAALADFVLPAAGTIERDDLAVYESGCTAYPRAMDPLHERRSDYQLWKELGRRLGRASDWPWETMRAVCEYRLAPAGLTFDELVERGGYFDDVPVGRSRELGFGTASGKVELRSSLLAELGHAPLPGYVPVPEATADHLPLLLITGSKFPPMYHSEQRQWPSARKQHPEPQVSLNPQTARSLGLEEGDWVRIETARGAIRQRVHLSAVIHPRMADSQHGWWFPERECAAQDPYGMLESNVNVLVGDEPEWCSEATGGWQQSGIPCRIEREA
jgi:anaerobic selenocysteine-containing dehydrogenase